jgi:hypothetical protein
MTTRPVPKCDPSLSVWPAEVEQLVRSLKALELEAEFCNPMRRAVLADRRRRLVAAIETAKRDIVNAESMPCP